MEWPKKWKSGRDNESHSKYGTNEKESKNTNKPDNNYGWHLPDLKSIRGKIKAKKRYSQRAMGKARMSYEKKEETDKVTGVLGKQRTAKEKEKSQFGKQKIPSQEMIENEKDVETVQFKGLGNTGRDKVIDKDILTNSKVLRGRNRTHLSRYSQKANEESESTLFQDLPNKDKNSKIKHKTLEKKRNKQKRSLAEFYIKEKQKLNIWTFLFGQVNSALAQILKMCELENKVAFFKGLLDTLKGFVTETEKLLHAREIENLKEPNKASSKAWEIRADNRSDSAALQSIHNIDQKKIENRFEDQDNVEFRLLNDLVTSGKLDFEEAIVLIIRERAQLMADSWGIDDGGSRDSVSRTLYAKELVETPSKKRRATHSSVIYHNSIEDLSKMDLERSRVSDPGNIFPNVSERKINSYEMLNTIRKSSFRDYEEEIEDRPEHQRNRSFSNRSEPRPLSSPIGFSKLLKRIEKRVKIDIEPKKIEKNSESQNQKHKELNDKQAQAQKRREERLKEFEKKSQILKKRHKKMKEKLNQEIQRKKRRQMLKQKEGAQLRQKYLKEKQKRAARQRMKVNEMSFLMILEKEAKQRDLDERLEETRKRKEEILAGIKKEIEEQNKIKEKKNLNREKKIRERKILMQKKFESKIEKAEKRRLENLEKKIRHSGRKRKMSERSQEVKFDFRDKVQAAKLEMKLAQADIERKMAGGPIEKRSQSSHNSDRSPNLNNSFDFADLTLKQPTKIPWPNKKSKQGKKRRKQLKKIPAWKNKYSHVLQDPMNSKLEGNDLLQHYYRMLTKDSDYSRTKRKTSFRSETSTESNRSKIISSKNIIKIEEAKEPVHQNQKIGMISQSNYKNIPNLKSGSKSIERRPQPILNSSNTPFTQISELPELITRQVQATKNRKEMESRLCILCDEVLGTTTNEQHLNSKKHKKNKSQYIFTSLEESNCIVECSHRELVNERFSYLRKKSKKVKQNLSLKCLHLAPNVSSKESYISENKKLIQTLALEFEKQLGSTRRDLKAVGTILAQFKKILAKNIENDLHIARMTKVPVLLIDFFKSIVSCPKFELPSVLELINSHFGLLSKLFLLRENRVSFFFSNKVTSLADLCLWGWSNMHRHVLCLNFLPDVFQALNLLLKQRLFPHSQVIKPLVVEYIIYSGLLFKIRQKFINYANNNTLVQNPRIALIAVKALGLMDTLTSFLEGDVQESVRNIGVFRVNLKSDDIRTNDLSLDLTDNMKKGKSEPVKMKLEKKSEDKKMQESNRKLKASLKEKQKNKKILSTKQFNSILFILKETECAGCLHLLASVLLSKGNFKRNGSKTLPQVSVSLSNLTLRVLNNLARFNLESLQALLSQSFNRDQFYHICTFLYDFSSSNYDKDQEAKEMLKQLIVLTGYFALGNPQNQMILSRGTETQNIVFKLASLPYQFYFGHSQHKDLLFPTLLAVCFDSSANLKILLSEINKMIIIKYIESQLEIYFSENELPFKRRKSTKNPNKHQKQREKKLNSSVFKRDHESIQKIRKGLREQNSTGSLSSQTSSRLGQVGALLLLNRFPVKFLPQIYKFIQSFRQ